jgi:DNA-binding CsgD family transcriptional regulator
LRCLSEALYDRRYVARHFLKFGLHAVTLTHGTMRIGRSPACELRLEGRFVSRHHATLFYDALGLRIRDEGSANGVFVNGRRVRGTMVLSPTDRVAIATEEFEVGVTNEPSDVPTQQHARQEIIDGLGKGFASLSHRERQVFEMLAHGLGNRDIGERLHLSPKTVETYRARLADKLGVRTRESLVDLALRVGVLTATPR